MPVPPLDRRNELRYERSTLYDDGTKFMSDWPKADPVTAPKVNFTLEAWQRLAMERGDEIARLGELVKILEARVAYLEQLHSLDHVK
jgi:hypothetical protein